MPSEGISYRNSRDGQSNYAEKESSFSRKRGLLFNESVVFALNVGEITTSSIDATPNSRFNLVTLLDEAVPREPPKPMDDAPRRIDLA